jgi:hypothetical protein
VICLRSEQFVELLILENSIKDPDFINCGFSSLISDSGKSNQTEESEMDFPNKSLVKHEETESRISNE